MKYFIILTILFYSCNPIDKGNYHFTKTLIIGHKASTKTKKGEKLSDNSYEAVAYGYKNLDGIEVDIRSSKDTTLWLIHDESINYSNNKILFSSLSDKEIQKINSETKDSIITLKQLFNFLSKQKNKKFVSLDMKVINNKLWLENRDKWINLIADSLAFFYNYYAPNSIVAVESWDINFLQSIKEKAPNIETYLMIWNPLEENDILFAKKKAIDGLSCNIVNGLDKKAMDLAKKKNIKIQTWTIKNETQTKQILKYNPTTMQVDNTNFFIK